MESYSWCRKCGRFSRVNYVSLICGWCMNQTQSWGVPENAPATKFDDDKLPMHLIPVDVLKAYTETLALGAKKYGPRNYEKGFEFSRLYGALLRHITAWWGGEEVDADGNNHLSAALFNVGALIHHTRSGVGTDDRP